LNNIYTTYRHGKKVEIQLGENWQVLRYSEETLIKEISRVFNNEVKNIEIYSETLRTVISNTVTKAEAMRMVKNIVKNISDRISQGAYDTYDGDVFAYERNPNFTCHFVISNLALIDSSSTDKTKIVSWDLLTSTVTLHV
jgi:phage-related tail protein